MTSRPLVERRAHDGVDLVLEEDRVAHDHGPAMGGGCERGPGAEPHEGRQHQPSTWTFTSYRALVTLKTFSSGISVPFTPMICSILAVSKAGLRERWCWRCGQSHEHE